MKTIFVSIFDGVEAKNLLRTDVIGRVLKKDPQVRVVLFLRTKERIEYYQKEFSDLRIIYEYIDKYEPNFMDRLFSKLKFNFLQTETTDLRARMIAEERGSFYYYYSIFLHRLLANRFSVTIFRALESRLVTCDLFDAYFDKYDPSLILLANLFEDVEANFLRVAKDRGVYSVGLINSWDKVTARCILRILPDKLLVFNDVVKKEVVETNYMRRENIFVSGISQYDHYFKPLTISREEFLIGLGLDPQDRIMLYSPIGGMFSNSDWEMIDFLYNLNTKGKFGERVKIFVSFPPNDFIRREELEKRPWLIYQYIGIRFSDVRSADWDISSKDLDNLKNLLSSASIVVCYASSLSIDAAVFDKPVININFEVKDNGRLSKSPTLFYKMTHYKKALDTGAIRLVDDEAALVEWVNKYLEDPSIDKEGRASLVEKQCQYTDGQSAQRIADFLLTQLK